MKWKLCDGIYTYGSYQIVNIGDGEWALSFGGKHIARFAALTDAKFCAEIVMRDINAQTERLI